MIQNKYSPTTSTHYTALAVEKDGHPILLHTHLSNRVVADLILENRISGLEGATIVRPEVKIGKSRFDFLLKRKDQHIVLEVKSCTLAGNKIAMFPDAVTARGRRHLLELSKLSRTGYRGAVIFLVHWPRSRFFMPDYHTDLDFSRTLYAVRERLFIKPLSVEWKRNLTLGKKVHPLKVPWDLIEREAQDRGSYIVILRMKRHLKLRVGALGEVLFRKGHYMYIGSARKNLTSRMQRHARKRKKLFWHIDYLREHSELSVALPIRASTSVECKVARALKNIADWSISAFGSSDCSCESHLFGMHSDPLRSDRFMKTLISFRINRLERELICGIAV